MNLKIRTLLLLVVVLEVAFLVLLEYLIIRLNTFEIELSKAVDDRSRLVSEADVLRQSSDDLTRFARTYVVTGDDRYRENYFTVLAIRSGEVPRPMNYRGIYWDLLDPMRDQRHPAGKAIALKDIMNALPYSEEERDKLALSEENSNDLVNLEVEAFNAMQGKLRDDNGEYTVAGEPSQALAIRLLHSPEYHQAKHNIMLPIDEFVTMLERRMELNVGQAMNRVEMYLRYQHIFTLLFIVFNIGVFFVLHQRVIKPVRSITDSIVRHRDEGQSLKFNHRANDEIGVMVSQLDSMSRGLADARESADLANRAKSAFLANMSHELRTPMNAILGYSEILMEEAEELGQEASIPDLKKINQAGAHLLSLINDVLDLSKIESGKMEAFPEEFNLDRLINEVATTVQPLMEKENNKLVVELGEQLGDAYQDLTKLRQALYNLVSNAAKFTHEGTITLHVEHTEQSGVDWLTLSVSDTGIGIADDKIDKVFEEFTQADGSTTRDYGGTGLGLAISRRFCQLLGGDLTLNSKLGRGSTFVISIPAILPGKKPGQPPVNTVVPTAGTDMQAVSEVVQGPTILVIDDDPEACDLIERNLVKDGFNIVKATSGEQGLRLAHDFQPVAITLDVMMPDMDGWSVLRALKADPVLCNIPVVMLSMIEDRTRGYSLGAVDYLTKPVGREELHKALGRYSSADGGRKVLLVDDDMEGRELMAHNLDKAGWVVSEAENGQKALDLMDAVQPQLILLDLMMPVMDGFGFLSAMRARPEWQHIPIIVITAKELTGEDRDRLNGMVDEVLEKSVDTSDDLLQRVREALSKCDVE